MGGINTCVLILSSMTMAMAVHFAQRSKQGPLVFCLFLTFLGACGFLVIKYFEYTHKIHANLVWGPGFYKPVEHGDGHAGGHAAADAHAATATPSSPNAVMTEHPVLGTNPGLASNSPPLFKLPPVESSTIKPLPAGTPGVSLVGEGDETQHQAEVAEAAHEEKVHLTDPEMPLNTHRFFGIYFAMTGLHGIHVIIGMFLIGWLMYGAAKGRFNSNYYTPVDLGGLYWHIVDLIWIFLFPLFYLIH
ncbi:MAG: cytochrome c oxidase subunit 3 [Phycisphaerae bacterium]|nr:cytochrome c oxidase subunit 3 [Phycisphaerae bacterium]